MKKMAFEKKSAREREGGGGRQRTERKIGRKLFSMHKKNTQPEKKVHWL